MSTTVHLLYRDACNYKTVSSVVFAGDPTPELVDRFLAAREESSFDSNCIVPEQVGLQHPAHDNPIFSLRFPDEEDDHGYVEIERDDIEETISKPTDDRTFEQFVIECEQANADGWDPDLAIAAAGGWQDEEKCARLRGGDVDE